MRLAYVCADRGVPIVGRSGSSIHVSEFITALCERGVEVTVFAASVPEEAASQLPCRVVDLTRDPLLNELRARIAKDLRREGNDDTRAAEVYNLLLNQTLLVELERYRESIDIVYERHSLWSLAGVQFARTHSVPYLLEVNAPLMVQQQQYRELDLIDAARSVERLVFSSADRIFVTTPGLIDYVRAAGGSRRKLRVLPCGVSHDMLVDPADRRVRDSGEFTIGFLGSLKPWHGIELMLEAFAELRALSSDYRLLVVGDGPLKREIQGYCRSHKLRRYVTLTGAVDHLEVPQYLARMDVGLAPYPPLDPFYFSPLKVWEYAAACVPVVASASGELPTLLPHRKGALLHEPGKVGKIVKHIEKLRTTTDLGPRLARRARVVARKHTWDRLASRVIRIAENLLAKG